MSPKDPYDILTVARGASQEEIKRAYRRLAKKYHPDRNQGDKHAEDKFKELQAANEVLGDPKRRAQYDRFGAGGPAPEFHSWGIGGASPFGDTSFSFDSSGDLTSIFEQFFRRGPAQRQRRATARRRRVRGADIQFTVDLSLEEAAAGTRREIALSGGPGGARERIEFRVPAGIDEGQLIRVKGKGQDGGGGRGDLMIRCHIRPHAFFRRDGLDLHLDLPLNLTEAALGTKVTVPTLDGPMRLTVPPGTASGTKLRLRGKGIHDERSGRTGDMLAIVRIHAPRDVSPRARELLEALAAELKDDPRCDLGWAL